MRFLNRLLHYLVIFLVGLTIVFGVVYILLQGHQGKALHIFRSDRYAYVSMGEYGQVAFYRIFEESLDSSRGGIDFPVVPQRKFTTLVNSYPKAVDPRIEDEGKYSSFGNFVASGVRQGNLYMVDQWKGLHRVKDDFRDLGDTTIVPIYGAKSIQFHNDYAFVPAGTAGLYIYDIRSSTNAVITGYFDTKGIAESLVLHPREISETLLITDLEVPQQRLEKVTRNIVEAFVADGPEGVTILDVTVPLTPTETVVISTEGYAHQVAYYVQNLYVADGIGGLRVFNVQDPMKFTPLEWPFSWTEFKIARELQLDVLDVAVNDQLIVAALGAEGILIFKNTIGSNSLPDNPVIYPTKGFVSSVELANNYVLLADGYAGIRLVDLADLNNPVERAHMTTPGTYTFAQLAANWGSPEGSPEAAKVDVTLRDIRNEIFFLLAGLIFWMGFFFLTIWPVPEPEFSAALKYWLRPSHGWPLHIENGETLSRREREYHPASRAAWLDTASAAIVQNPHDLRILGPGMGFIEPGERLGRTLDLRPGSILCGPEIGEDPFADQYDSETDQQYKERQARRQQTAGCTRDGVEIVPSVLVDVRVNGRPGDGSSEYGFNAETALLAMRPDLKDYDDLLPFTASAGSWRQVPVNLVTRLWFHYLQKFSLEELFTPIPDPQQVFDSAPSTGLERVQQMLLWHLTKREVPRLNDEGQPVGQQLSSEFQQLERSGLVVSSIQIVDLRLPVESAETYLTNWEYGWLARVRQQVMDLKEREREVQERARLEARSRFSEIILRSLGALRSRPTPSVLPTPEQNRSMVLASMVRGTLNLQDLTEPQRQRLNELLAWLEGWN